MWLNFEEKEVSELAAKLEAAGFIDLATKLRERLAEGEHEDTAAYIKAAKELYEDNDNDIEVDDRAIISEGDIGAFVMAWVFVRFGEAGFAENRDEDEDDETPFDAESPEGRAWATDPLFRKKVTA